MWIAFRIVFLLMIPNATASAITSGAVVNCFQNCIFTYDSQRRYQIQIFWFSCELLSELYFYLWFPTELYSYGRVSSLWIAFRIVFLLMIPNNKDFKNLRFDVVNCFQNCIFTYDSQQKILKTLQGNCCELLSELYFYLWFPTKGCYNAMDKELWIAFRIVFLLMIPNCTRYRGRERRVVNCFQNCIFTYDSQH